MNPLKHSRPLDKTDTVTYLMRNVDGLCAERGTSCYVCAGMDFPNCPKNYNSQMKPAKRF